MSLSRRKALKAAPAALAVLLLGHHRPGHQVPPGHTRRNGNGNGEVKPDPPSWGTATMVENGIYLEWGKA